MYLPNDSDMLFSMINMKLRDQYDSFFDLCDSEDIDPAPLIVKLNAAGYEYDEEHNCFQYAEVLHATTCEEEKVADATMTKVEKAAVVLTPEVNAEGQHESENLKK